MTTKVAHLSKTMRIQASTKPRVAPLDVWEAICGMWKDRKIDAVKYQRDLRKEADHVK